jgi:hypothetical protein
MTEPHSNELAYSLLRFYGARQAQLLARKYARDSTAINDSAGYAKWTAAAAHISQMVDHQRRLGE